MSNIIIVDDSIAIRTPLRVILKELGHLVFSFENGKLALDFAKKDIVDLVITDINMPIMDGMTLISELRELILIRIFLYWY